MKSVTIKFPLSNGVAQIKVSAHHVEAHNSAGVAISLATFMFNNMDIQGSSNQSTALNNALRMAFNEAKGSVKGAVTLAAAKITKLPITKWL